MSLRHIPPRNGDPPVLGQPPPIPPYVGHAHFWQRALSRHQFLKVSMGVAGGVVASRLWNPGSAQAAEPSPASPKPIPGGIQPFGPGTEVFHVFLPAFGSEPSTITDFDGKVGIARITGYGTKTDTSGAVSRPFYDADMRFMKGVYIGMDGEPHKRTYGFF